MKEKAMHIDNITTDSELTPQEREALERSIFEHMMSGEFDDAEPTAETNQAPNATDSTHSTS